MHQNNKAIFQSQGQLNAKFKAYQCVLSRWVFYVGLVFLSACGSDNDKAASTESKKPSYPAVEVATISRADPNYEIQGQGFLQPAEQVTIVSEVSGTVEWVADKLSPGSLVKEGTELIRIEQDTYKAERDRAQAILESAKATLSETEKRLERLEYLAEIGASADAQRDAVRAEQEAASAALARAQAQLTIAEERLDDTVIRAPFDAEVIDETVTLGMFLSPASPVAQLFDVSSGEIVVGLKFEDAQAVQRAMQAAETPLAVSIFRSTDSLPQEPSANNKEPSASHTGKLVSMDSVLDATSRTVNFRISVPRAFKGEEATRLLVNEFVTVNIPALSEGLLYKSEIGVVRQEQFVFLIDENEQLKRVAVIPIQRDDKKIVFASSEPLEGKRALITSLAEEQNGLRVSVQTEKQTQSSQNPDS